MCLLLAEVETPKAVLFASSFQLTRMLPSCRIQDAEERSVFATIQLAEWHSTLVISHILTFCFLLLCSQYIYPPNVIIAFLFKLSMFLLSGVELLETSKN